MREQAKIASRYLAPFLGDHARDIANLTTGVSTQRPN
jgi:hypothetical protein